jgi:hypothetical protein
MQVGALVGRGAVSSCYTLPGRINGTAPRPARPARKAGSDAIRFFVRGLRMVWSVGTLKHRIGISNGQMNAALRSVPWLHPLSRNPARPKDRKSKVVLAAPV